jgi:hypothetical protein
MFFKGTRYEKVDTNQITDSTGRVIVYKKTRFIPITTGVVSYTVKQDDRLDQIANRSFRDPQRFWRICDANDAMWPDDLTAVGRKLEIPPSEG